MIDRICKGCGATLQSDDKNLMGFVPEINSKSLFQIMYLKAYMI